MKLPSWVPAGEEKPAPGRLLLVQSFVNTWDIEAGTDGLSDAREAAGWLREAGLLGRDDSITAAGLEMAQRVRESIRALLVANSGATAPAAADLRPLRELARTAEPVLSLDPGGQVRLDPGPHPHPRLAGSLVGLLLIIRDSQRSGEWPRLKVCRNPGCMWSFYDRSHSRRGAWCDMAVCGNRMKNRNFRARRGAGT